MLAGDPAAWLAHFRDLEERMIEAIEIAWPLCIAPLQSKKNQMTHEDHITSQLVVRLRQGKKLPGRIEYQYSLLDEAADQTAFISGNIDLVLTIGDDEDVYLACECKRLNVPYESRPRSLAGEYVEDGLMRFVTGQYSNGLPLAMMLGYVMNALTDRAEKSVKRAMNSRKATIRLQTQRNTSLIAGRPVRFFSTHVSTSGGAIEISHTLLGWP